MALQKEKETRYGMSASYWKIGMVTIDRHMKEASFTLNLYMNRESKEFLESFIVADLMNNEDKALYDKYFENKDEYTDIYNACYMYCKENVDYFKDAEDI